MHIWWIWLENVHCILDLNSVNPKTSHDFYMFELELKIGVYNSLQHGIFSWSIHNFTHPLSWDDKRNRCLQMNTIILLWTVLVVVGKPRTIHYVKYTYEFTYEVKICQEWNVFQSRLPLVGIISLSPSRHVQNLTLYV